MNQEVALCVAPRADFFGKYCEVPAYLQSEVETFLADLHRLGEESADAATFEAAFANSGLSDQFNLLVSRCTPKAYQMTAEDKAYSRQVANEIFREDKDRILKEAAVDLGEAVALKVESDVNTVRIRTMSEMDILDDYTRASNAVDIAGRAVGTLGKLFRKKKK
ncbi:MAG: hypothetical protein IKU10_03750 [Clostridia bacterium]|nr:hypothetical protein [Clostridia bacterium]